MNYARYEIVTKALRDGRPMTAKELAAHLNWKVRQVNTGLRLAQNYALVHKLHKQPDNQFVYGAMQVPGWPNPAPDCKPRTYDTLAERDMDRESLIERLSTEA